MNWYIGQPIVAIKNSKCGKIKKGQEFKIIALKQNYCQCGNHIIIDVGVKKEPHNGVAIQRCTGCGYIEIYESVQWKHENLFAPLDVNISELTDILKQELIEKQP